MPARYLVRMLALVILLLLPCSAHAPTINTKPRAAPHAAPASAPVRGGDA